MASGPKSRIYPQVFSWPPEDAFAKGSKSRPEEIGIELIEHDAKSELITMVQKAKNDKRDEAFCVFDMGTIIERFFLWRKAFTLVQPFYAVKTYNDPVVLKLLAELGTGFDCATKGEIELLHELGVKSENIVFANTVKIPSHLRYAADVGISLMTFDSHDELHKIKQWHPKARLLLRLLPETDSHVEFSLFEQYGCKTEEVDGLLRTAKQLDLCVVGVCFHIGSGCTDSNVYLRELDVAQMVFGIAKQEGIHMTILDIGGGFSGKTGSEQVDTQVFQTINTHLAKNFPGVKIMAEPGRYFVESGLKMATSVIGGPKRGTDLETVGKFVVSASAFGILNRSITFARYGEIWYHPELVLREPSSNEHYDYILKGPTCAPIDLIKCRNLPKLRVGDWLIFEDVGAYTVCIASTFNGLQLPPIRRVMSKNMWDSFFTYHLPTLATANGV